MEEIKLDVQIRQEIGSQPVKAVRREDMVPCVVYGGEGAPTHIKADRRTFERIRRQHHGEVVFHLNVWEGEKKIRDYSAIVKEEQHDSITDKILHIDFKRISLKEEIEVKVRTAAKGEAIGVKRDGGSLEHVLWELDVVCLPTNIPEELAVDISNMEIGDTIHVKDIALPAGVKTKHDPETIVFSVVAPHEEEAEEEAGEGVEPEVIKAKKEKAEPEAGDEASEKKKEEE